jgi:hypothetical protein
VAGFVRVLLGSWRAAPIDLRSTLPVDAAVARLHDGAESVWRSSFTLSVDVGRRRVYGRVADHYFRLWAAEGFSRNSWRPVARGELEPDGPGCRLLGQLRVGIPVLLLSTVWLALAALGSLVALLATVATLVTGDFTDARPAAITAGVACAVLLIGGLLTGAGLESGREDGEFLLDWLAERLETGRQGGPSRSRPPE